MVQKQELALGLHEKKIVGTERYKGSSLHTTQSQWGQHRAS